MLERVDVIDVRTEIFGTFDCDFVPCLTLSGPGRNFSIFDWGAKNNGNIVKIELLA